MPVPKTDALPLGYTPYGLFWTVERGEGEGRSRLEKRAVQGRGDIASKRLCSPFRTDYNKLATLIETNGKLSALFACKAMHAYQSWLRVHRKSVTFVTVSIWYSLNSFNSSLKAFGVMNRFTLV